MDNGQDNTATAVSGNGHSTPEERENIAGQLAEEQREMREVEAAISERDTRIGELEAALERTREEVAGKQVEMDNAWAEMTALREVKDAAVFGYRDALRLAHPELPADLITGDSPEELAASVVGAQALVEKVRAALQSERQAARMPAGAPVDSGPDLAGLSAREKIAAGVTHPSK
ncbi:MAG: hypothetical protein JW846_08270 [Dehalococcoidia bacterium]|nr:hypothetical protein [Dehalococcoidia bacterium]